MKNWCVFISGTGSNLRAFMDSRNSRVSLVVSDKEQVRGLCQSKSMGVPFYILPKPTDWNALHLKLKSFGITDIFLAGFMKVLPKVFTDAWKDHLYNIHPSFLPNYPGLKSIERCFDEKGELGVTIHRVDETIDGGEIVLQKKMNHMKDIVSTEINVHIREHTLIRKFSEMRN